MNSLIENEVIGTVAIQEVLRHSPGQRLPLSKAMLILPLLFNKKIRGVLKHKSTKIVSSKDLVLSYPEDCLKIRIQYQNLLVRSINTQLLAIELGLAAFSNDTLLLTKPLFSDNGQKIIGRLATEIFSGAINTAKILQEDAVELYSNFGIEA